MFQWLQLSEHDISMHLGVQPLTDQAHTPRHLWVRGWPLVSDAVMPTTTLGEGRWKQTGLP